MIAEAWFAVAVMLGIHSDGTQDVYIFQQPEEHGHFHSAVECTTFVNENPKPLIQTLWKYYGQRPVERVICVREDRLKDFVSQQEKVDT